jgi:HlyD family secretion protein
MKHKRPPIPVIIIVVLAILVGAYFGIRALLDKSNGALTASGTIEAVEVTISPELSGKVTEVLVDEGDSVKAGDELFRLDDSLLQAQRAVAAAGLDLARATASTADYARLTARANFFPVLDAARAESAATRTADWRGGNPAGYTLPGGYFSQLDQMAAAQAEVDNAQAARDLTQTSLTTLLVENASAEFATAETRLLNARAALIVAQDVLTRATLSNNTDLQNTAQTAYDDAKTELEDAQSTYDSLKNTEAAKSIIIARADLAVAQERYEAAQDRLLTLQTGENSPKVAVARAALQQAISAADQAYLAVTQAEASLALLDTQIAKLMVKAPADGVILTRNIEPGEVIAPSAAVMTLGRLDSLTITVYIPEDRYGELTLGQVATVSVDSFPGKTFAAKVINIADQAEFTPRNVQTVEGRKSTVFAIKLQVQESDGKLKPGMTADVIFDDKGKGK